MPILTKQSSCIQWALLLPALIFLSTFSAYADAPIDAERAAELKVTPIGTRLGATRQIPAFSVDVRTGLDLGPDDRAFAELPTLPRGINAKALSWIHLTGYGWLLIPKGWQVVDGGVGADGSMVLVAQSQSGAAWLEYSDAGQCVGCAINAASCFYPQAKAQALEYDFDLSACGKSGVSSTATRVPALQYQANISQYDRQQTLRHYRDSDGIGYQQLQLHQPSLAEAAGATEIDLKNHALGIFFKRVWVVTE